MCTETGCHRHKWCFMLKCKQRTRHGYESRPSRKRVADVQTEDLEDNEQMDASESAASLPLAEEERGYFVRKTVAAQVEQTAQVLSGQCGREESSCELQRSREQCSS